MTKVLCVIADIICLERKIAALADAGYEVTQVTSAKAARQKVMEEFFEVLICEQHLNTLNTGLAFARDQTGVHSFLKHVVLVQEHTFTPVREDNMIYFYPKSTTSSALVDFLGSVLANPRVLA